VQCSLWPHHPGHLHYADVNLPTTGGFVGPQMWDNHGNVFYRGCAPYPDRHIYVLDRRHLYERAAGYAFVFDGHGYKLSEHKDDDESTALEKAYAECVAVGVLWPTVTPVSIWE
jgi:hypothetical protein